MIFGSVNLTEIKVFTRFGRSLRPYLPSTHPTFPLLDTHIYCMAEHNCLLSKGKSFKNVLKEESYKEQRKLCMLLFKMHIVVLK